MIEIGEAAVLTWQMAGALPGKTILAASFLDAPHKFCWVSPSPEAAVGRVVGKTIADVIQHGNRIVIRLDGGMNVALGEDETIRFDDPDERKTQMLLRFQGGGNLTCRVKMYGYVTVGTEAELRANPYYAVNADAPNPLRADFTRKYFDDLVAANRKLSVKALLATKQNIPGVGNGTIQDVLFRAGIRPMAKTAELSPEDVARLYDALLETVRLIVAAGGRASFTDLFGVKGGYPESMRNAKGICPACGEALIEKAYMGGKVTYCPRCQR